MAIQHNTIWCLEPDMSCMAWFQAWVDDPGSGQRQKEYSTWEANKRKFRKIPAKKEEKGTDQRKRTKKRTKEKTATCWMERRKKRKNKNRPATKNKEKQKGKHHIVVSKLLIV